LQAMFKDLFPEEYIAVVQGDWRAAKELVQRDFDFIFFTGSTHVGREVMSAAAENLTPVTLELGGKCPCIVCSDADIEVAGRRIAWGKLLNSGQTCVAPDYVLVEKHIRESFLKRLKESFCGNASNAGESMQRIINATHFERLVSYLEHGTVFAGGKYNRDKLQISPTIMVQVDRNSKLMHEEIFGPILPVITCENLDEAIHTVQAGPKPLALYLFASNKRAHQRIVAETSSGGLCINDTVSHLLNKELPFGGVGHSGMGSYHGKAGFDCFTHFKSALKRSTLIDPDQYTRNNKAPLSALKRMYSFLLR
ncbi:MAG: aldehyde dehydrogenase family protein, partial [Verrucomicrobiota bacterium]